MCHIIDEFVRYQLFQEEAQGMDAQLAKKYYSTTEESLPDSKPIIVNPGVLFDAEEGDDEDEEDVEVRHNIFHHRRFLEIKIAFYVGAKSVRRHL